MLSMWWTRGFSFTVSPQDVILNASESLLILDVSSEQTLFWALSIALSPIVWLRNLCHSSIWVGSYLGGKIMRSFCVCPPTNSPISDHLLDDDGVDAQLLHQVGCGWALQRLSAFSLLCCNSLPSSWSCCCGSRSSATPWEGLSEEVSVGHDLRGWSSPPSQSRWCRRCPRSSTRCAGCWSSRSWSPSRSPWRAWCRGVATSSQESASLQNQGWTWYPIYVWSQMWKYLPEKLTSPSWETWRNRLEVGDPESWTG